MSALEAYRRIGLESRHRRADPSINEIAAPKAYVIAATKSISSSARVSIAAPSILFLDAHHS